VAGTPKTVEALFKSLTKKLMRRHVLEKGIRVDGRKVDEVRPIHCEVGVLPRRVHGSAVFQRGSTQVLSAVTLGTPGDAQDLADDLHPEDEKRYLHHYNFPPYSVGEAKPMRAPSRREIGHGALAERALLPVLPSKTDFPYVLRVVSEVSVLQWFHLDGFRVWFHPGVDGCGGAPPAPGEWGGDGFDQRGGPGAGTHGYSGH
jgi:polyribonucleotide nucleotidyltransferase